MECVSVFPSDILPLVNVFWVDEGIHKSAHHALLVSARRNLSLVDVVSFEAMRLLDLTHSDPVAVECSAPPRKNGTLHPCRL
jgi:hypothetical protein